jgi:hypothetical protein
MSFSPSDYQVSGNAPESPGFGSVAVTPSDATTYDPPLRSVYVTAGGAVAFEGVDGLTDAWTVPDAFLLPVRVRRVLATGTTATGLHGIR